MLLERNSDDHILDALYFDLDSKQQSFSAEDYSCLKKSIEQLMNGEQIEKLPESKGRKNKNWKIEVIEKPNNRYRWLKKLMSLSGLLYIWEILRSIWKQLGLTIRTDGNGKLIIVSTAGGCLVISTGIWSCYYRDRPLFEHTPRSQQVSFCIRDLSVKMTPAADMELDKKFTSFTMTRLIAQTELGSLYALHQQSNPQNLSLASVQNPYLGYGIHMPSFFSDCGIISDNRLRIDIRLTIDNEIKHSTKFCYQDGKCFDSFVRSANCVFSFLIHDDLDEYECPVREFNFSSPGMSYLEMNIQPSQIDAHQRAIQAIESCKGAISSISLLGGCRRRVQSTIR